MRRGLAAVTAACTAAVTASGCSATHVVRPLPAGSRAVTASLGGPVLPNSVPTGVVPYLTIGLQQGRTDDLTVGGALHATMLAFGVAAGEVNATYRLRRESGAIPELVGRAGGIVMAGPGGVRLYPSIGTVASWSATRGTLLYAGGDLMAQTTAPHLLAAPLVGIQRRVSDRTAVQLDAKWMAANVDTRRGVFEGESSIGGRGAFALQLGLVVGGRARP